MKIGYEKPNQKNADPQNNPADAKEIKLTFRNPPLDRLDPMILSTLVNCERLSLSTNAISVLVPFNGMSKLSAK